MIQERIWELEALVEKLEDQIEDSFFNSDIFFERLRLTRQTLALNNRIYDNITKGDDD